MTFGYGATSWLEGESMSILGTRVVRIEDPAFLTRGAVYTDDVQDERLDGACYVFFVRSPIAPARVNSVDLGAGGAAPGVIAAYTAADLLDGVPDLAPMMSIINQDMTQPLLARDVVRFAGEPVAVIVTEQAYQGEDAAELGDVDYDPRPVVVAMPDAGRGAAQPLFPAAGSNVAATFGDAATFDPNLFDGCEVVVSRTLETQRVAPAPMEPRAAAAVWGEDGRVTAWIPNQGAQGTRGSLAGMLGPDHGGARV